MKFSLKMTTHVKKKNEIFLKNELQTCGFFFKISKSFPQEKIAH